MKYLIFEADDVIRSINRIMRINVTNVWLARGENKHNTMVALLRPHVYCDKYKYENNLFESSYEKPVIYKINDTTISIIDCAKIYDRIMTIVFLISYQNNKEKFIIASRYQLFNSDDKDDECVKFKNVRGIINEIK